MVFRIALAALSFLGMAAAQSAAVGRLASFDWRERNAAALELANGGELPIDDLLTLLATPWAGPEFLWWRSGGRMGPPASLDPREQVVAAATKELGFRAWKVRPADAEDTVATAADLCVPWHPHALADWLLRSRPSARAEIARALADRPVAGEFLASLWVVSAHPDADRVLARDLTDAELAPVLRALWLGDGDGRTTVGRLLVRGDGRIRSAIVRLGDPAVLTDDAAVDAAIGVFLAGGPEAGHAGWLLIDSGIAVPRLRAHLGRGADSDRALLGLLCVLGEQVGEVGDELLPCLGGERVVRQRALVVLASGTVPPATAAAAAPVVLAIVEGRHLASHKLVAIDALGNLGAAVDAAARTRLAKMAMWPPMLGGTERLFGCLQRLGETLDLSPERKVRTFGSPMAPRDVLLAIAADPTVPAEELHDALLQSWLAPSRVDCVQRVFERSPATVLDWLDAEPELQAAAIEVLRRAPPTAVDAGLVVGLLRDPQRSVQRSALAWLAEREDAADHTAAGLAAIAALHGGWSSAADDGRSDPESIAFVRRVAPAFAVLDSALGSLFHLGIEIELLDGCDPKQVETAARSWLAAADSPWVRRRLLAWFVRRGALDDGLVADVGKALQAPAADILLTGLEQSPWQSAELCSALERCIDGAFAAAAAGAKDTHDGFRARRALLAHARR